MRRLTILAAALLAVAATQAPEALAAKAPPAAVAIAVGAARARFHTTVIRSVVSLRSRRDPRWVLVDGFATRRNRLWAAWLHQDAARWTLRYFDTTAPFEPNSTAHGRVPCDLYPAFSEPACHPGPTDAQIRASLAAQLPPAGPAARIGVLLRRGAYTFTFRPPVNGTLSITWRGASAGRHATRSVLAHGPGTFLNGRPGRMTITLTAAGRRALTGARAVTIRGSATLTPIIHAAVTATRSFTLHR